MLTPPSLPQPKRAASSTPSLRSNDFVEFQNAFVRMKNEARQMTENGLEVDWQQTVNPSRKHLFVAKHVDAHLMIAVVV
jgi:hypothetical protein